ncbi:hypothetical protein TNCV_3533001 [Trichonephila clavipes]|nr:hypothetical protein TNCV_3533001 [Trichonephila clavipes]
MKKTLHGETLQKLRRAIQNKWRGMLTAGVILHDNARPHTARRTASVLMEFGWELNEQTKTTPELEPTSPNHHTTLRKDV